MVALLSEDNTTHYCEFSYDNWEEDGDSLPKIGVAGKGKLSTIKGCCQGSIAVGTDGSIKMLCGAENEWKDY